MQSLKILALVPALVLAGFMATPNSASAMCSADHYPRPCNDTPNYASPVRPPVMPQNPWYPEYYPRTPQYPQNWYFYPQYQQPYYDVYVGHPLYGGGYGSHNGWYL